MLQGLDFDSGTPVDAGRQIRGDYARNLRLAIDAGASTMPPEAMPYHTGKSRNGYNLVGTGSVSPSGPGWLGSTSTSVTCNTPSTSGDELLQLPANSDFTAQFVVDNFGGSTGYPCFFRSGSTSLSNNLMLTNETRRPFIRVNGSDILRPGSGPQWTDGQKINYIIRFRNALTIEAWWDGALKHSASHSASLPDITGIEAVYKLLVSGGGDEVRGNVSAIRVWSRWLHDGEVEELADDPGALYEPQSIWVPPAGGAVTNTLTASLSAAVQAARSATASVAAAVQTSQTATASAAAAVQAANTATASVATAVQADRTSTASVAAAVQAAHSATATLDAAVQRGQTATASIAAAVQAAHSATASAAAAVQASQSATASLSAYVQAGSTVTASLSAAVQAAHTAQASIAAAVQAPRTAQASLAAAVAQAGSVSASLAAGVQEARSASASLSAQVQAGTTVVALLSAAILEARAASASIAAAVAVARTASASLSTAIAVQRSLTALFQSAVEVRRTASASLAAYISTPGDHTISPRLYLVDPQDRAYLIDPEDRTYIVPASSRSTAA